MTFRGGVAVVTGAASGMGQLFARRLAAQGATVVAADIDEPGLDATARHARSVEQVRLDVTDADAITELVARVERDHGGIDRLVNAAGIARVGLLAEQDVDEIELVMRVNYLGTMRLVKAALPGMLARNSGDIVNFASLAGWLPTTRLGAYDASKFAVVAFSEVLAHEQEDTALRICCVCPPVVETPMVDGMRARDPASLAGQRGIQPGVVIDAVERGLDAGELFVFPGRGTRTLQRARRLAPGPVWSFVRRTQTPGDHTRPEAGDSARRDAGDHPA
jgi:NAD(P)-dependent dehydrogenase (short-subunit alcohol dehydrogenase family)